MIFLRWISRSLNYLWSQIFQCQLTDGCEKSPKRKMKEGKVAPTSILENKMSPIPPSIARGKKKKTTQFLQTVSLQTPVFPLFYKQHYFLNLNCGIEHTYNGETKTKCTASTMVLPGSIPTQPSLRPINSHCQHPKDLLSQHHATLLSTPFPQDSVHGNHHLLLFVFLPLKYSVYP